MITNTNNQETKISIITVGMNHLKYLKELFTSLYITNPPDVNFEVIYIDNCSKDESVDFIRNNFPNIKVFVNEKPLGLGRIIILVCHFPMESTLQL